MILVKLNRNSSMSYKCGKKCDGGVSMCVACDVTCSIWINLMWRIRVRLVQEIVLEEVRRAVRM